MKIDTHVHTTCSDGRKTATETIRLAAGLGIRLLSITDHDTTDGYATAIGEAESCGVGLLPGVELSTRDEDGLTDVHIVGLGIDPASDPLRRQLSLLMDARNEAKEQLLYNVNDYLVNKYPDWDPVSFDSVRRRVSGVIVGKPHIYAAIMENGLKHGILISEEDMYRIFKSPGIETKKSYELSMEESMSLIKASGGVSVLAHPFEYARPDAVMKKFKRLGGTGTELCRYRQKTKMRAIRELEPYDRIAAERQMNLDTIELAKRYGLKLTACTDYHGKGGEPGMETDEYGIDIRWLL